MILLETSPLDQIITAAASLWGRQKSEPDSNVYVLRWTNLGRGGDVWAEQGQAADDEQRGDVLPAALADVECAGMLIIPNREAANGERYRALGGDDSGSSTGCYTNLGKKTGLA